MINTIKHNLFGLSALFVVIKKKSKSHNEDGYVTAASPLQIKWHFQELPVAVKRVNDCFLLFKYSTIIINPSPVHRSQVT